MNGIGKLVVSVLISTALAYMSYMIVGDFKIVTFLYGGMAGLLIHGINDS